MADDYFDQTVYLLKPHTEQGATFATVRRYVRAGSFAAHVKTLPAAEVSRHKMVGADISHNVWAESDPGIDETWRLEWRGTILRPAGPFADLHGQGEVFLVAAKAISPDNEKVEVMQ